jgi:hypothetical protein
MSGLSFRRRRQVDKAQIERLTQLSLMVQGKPTKRSRDEILKSEKVAAEKYIPAPKVTSTGPEKAEV